EVRLQKERALTEKEMAELDERLAAEDTTPGGLPDTAPRTTTAPEGATIEEVRAGMQVHEGDGPMGYAAEGSLARELEKEKREKSKGGEGEKGEKG
ncbi:MAG: hypothetical protein Q9201_007787, partial [Fulgogasparrea decipioides]